MTFTRTPLPAGSSGMGQPGSGGLGDCGSSGHSEERMSEFIEVFPTTGGIEVGLNEFGELVIRQEDITGHAANVVFVPAELIDLFLGALAKAAGRPEVG